MKDKIVMQYYWSLDQSDYNVSNSRFGSFIMDLAYIKAQPFIGNGVHVKTRYRFHPSVSEDIGHGNGMSNFIVCWGIPLFILWSYNSYKYYLRSTNSHKLAVFCIAIMILILQGEHFLNYPIFLMFFFIRNMKSSYENSMAH